MPWSATLLSPTSAVRHDSQEPVSVRVDAPVVLRRSQRAQIGFEARSGAVVWGAGVWAGEPDGSRVVSTLLGQGSLRVPPGLYWVLVRISAEGHQPVLKAGPVSIT